MESSFSHDSLFIPKWNDLEQNKNSNSKSIDSPGLALWEVNHYGQDTV